MNIKNMKTLKDLEVFLATWYAMLPSLPKQAKKVVVEVLPYAVFFMGVYLLIISVVPYLAPHIPLRLLDLSHLLTFNIFLLQTLYILVGISLILTFKLLSTWRLKGWYNLYYISLIQLMISLIFFNVYSVVSMLLFWYVLFQIKSEYS